METYVAEIFVSEILANYLDPSFQFSIRKRRPTLAIVRASRKNRYRFFFSLERERRKSSGEIRKLDRIERRFFHRVIPNFPLPRHFSTFHPSLPSLFSSPRRSQILPLFRKVGSNSPLSNHEFRVTGCRRAAR